MRTPDLVGLQMTWVPESMFPWTGFTGPEAEIGAGFGPQIAQDSCEPEEAARGEFTSRLLDRIILSPNVNHQSVKGICSTGHPNNRRPRLGGGSDRSVALGSKDARAK